MAVAPQTRGLTLQRFSDAQALEGHLGREWLLTNGRGGFASGTPVGVATRRYHGLLIAAARPPLERWLMLSGLLERLTLDGRTRELASFEFDGAMHPKGYRLQTGFEARNTPSGPWARFDYEADEMRVTKRVLLSRDQDEVRVAYRVDGSKRAHISLDLLPFVPMRDFHGVTHEFPGGFPVHQVGGQCVVEAYPGGPRLWMHVERTDRGGAAVFEPQSDWWRGFVYRAELHRGFSDREDLFVPGFFRIAGEGCLEIVFCARADFSAGPLEASPPAADVCVPVPTTRTPSIEERLQEAADAFVVRRRRADGCDSTTVLAGYHWFGDWGRDTFIALPGLLLETGRFEEARQVLETFASAQKDGLIPNRFSDYGDGCDYNSVDASLWFLHAAAQFCRRSGDSSAWRAFLSQACGRIVNGFLQGTQFNIFIDTDGLVSCGDASTQLTWMDAKYGDIVFTPRHGKPVEINALWYNGLMELSLLAGDHEPGLAAWYRELAQKAQSAFIEKFWNPQHRCLYDVVRGGERDGAIRPNQIFAVSLPHSPLSEVQRQHVLACVEFHLLTPYGLRSLAPGDPKYRGRYEGNPFERDSAYHQGTVWGWLIGPFIEAFLRVHDFSPQAKARARELLAPLIAHLDEAGIGSVSEVFDGDPPHRPGGCIAQAWSVAELLRAWKLSA